MDPKINKPNNINNDFEIITNTSFTTHEFISSLNEPIYNTQNSFQHNDLPKTFSFSLTSPLKSFANALYYNYLPSTTSTKINPYVLSSFKPTLPLYLFNTKYSEEEELSNGFVSHNNIQRLHKSFLSELSKLILFTYRTNICTPNNIFDSDCGWGCTIRACQMLIAKGIVDNKIHQYKLSNNNTITQEHITSLIKETLLLFYDNDIPIRYCKGNNDYKHVLSSLNNNNAIKVTPPFSITNICAVTRIYNKFTSSQFIVEAFAEISKRCLSNSIRILSVESTDISQQYLRSRLFDGNGNTCHMGIVFINFRFNFFMKPHETCITHIRCLFKRIRNNIGFVSGSSSRAYYFIGACIDKDDLVYVDPHFNHKALINNFNSDITSYMIKTLYRIGSKHITPYIQLGVLINSESDYKVLISDLEGLSKCCDYICLK